MLLFFNTRLYFYMNLLNIIFQLTSLFFSNCDFVVSDNRDPKYCSMCQCKYENRNTTVIKVSKQI